MIEPSLVRQRHELSSVQEKSHWQRFFMWYRRFGWCLSLHVTQKVLTGDLTICEIIQLMLRGCVWAVEFGTDDPNLADPLPKFLVRWPTGNPNEWKTAAVVAIGENLTIVTAFRR